VIDGVPERPAALLPAVLGGAGGAVGLGLYYHAAQRGRLGVIAPISASSVALPVLVGLLRGEAPTTIVQLGLVALLVGGLLVSRSSDPPDVVAAAAAGRRPIVLALVAAVFFGTFYLGLDASGEEGGALMAVAAARVAAVLVLGAALLGRGGLPRPGALPPVVLLVGALDVGANALFALGAAVGSLPVVAATGSLYPLASVVLGRTMLGERLGRGQAVGVAAAVVGVALTAAG
jgi:drug/metabolite transporter (DMT)-like permease